MSSDFVFMLEVVFQPWSRRKQLEWRALRCLSGLVRTRKSDDDTDIDQVLLIVALATGDELELSVHLLWLMQEMSEKNTPNVLL